MFSIWVALEQGIAQPPIFGALIFAVLTIAAALLMVSNYEYFSPKTNFRERIPFVTLVLIAMGFAIAMIDPPMIMMGIALVYAACPAKSLAKT